MNFNDLYNASANVEDSPTYEDNILEGPDALPNDERVTAKIAYCKAGTSKGSGAPQWINKLEITSGEYQGGQFWDTITLSVKTSDGAKRYNKAQFAKLAAAGVTPEFLASNPSQEAIEAVLKDSTVDVIINWEKPDADGKVWSRHVWTEAADPSTGGYVPGQAPAGY